MVGSVRAEYDGLLTYDMHYSVITRDWFPWGKYLWEDLGLDVVGVSAWFPLAGMPPSSVTSVDTLQQEYERIFGNTSCRLLRTMPAGRSCLPNTELSIRLKTPLLPAAFRK